MGKVQVNYRVYDNCIEIIPVEGVKDNSIYEIKLRGIKSVSGKELPRLAKSIVTKISPCYCTLDAVKILLDDFDVSDEQILFFIRQASRQAEYINGGPAKLDAEGRPPYVIEKYTEVKATYDALVKAYITGNNDAGMEGTLGQLTFKNGDALDNLRKLLDNLKGEIKTWQDAIRGYEFEGRNEITFSIRANKTRHPTPARVIYKEFTRNINMGTDRS